MSQPPTPGAYAVAVPQFYVTPKQRFSPRAFALAVVIAVGCLLFVLYGPHHRRRGYTSGFGSGGAQSGAAGSGGGSMDGDDDDDPSRMDTIYLGGPSEAPSTTRPAAHPSSVHPFVVVHLPRSGDQVGQIPNTAAGQLLYGWLASFNSKNAAEAAKALPVPESDEAQEAEVELRKETGGFSLISAKEIEPGVLVFRLQDQTAANNEVLGTLQVRPDSNPPSIGRFSLRAVPSPPPAVH